MRKIARPNERKIDVMQANDVNSGFHTAARMLRNLHVHV